jgi:hypothetical protein
VSENANALQQWSWLWLPDSFVALLSFLARLIGLRPLLFYFFPGPLLLSFPVLMMSCTISGKLSGK